MNVLVFPVHPMPTSTPSPRRRPWVPWRLRLRMLIVLVLAMGGGLGWYMLKARREIHRQWVYATIVAAGAYVEHDGVEISRIFWNAGNSTPAVLPQQPLSADEVVALGSCGRLRQLDMVAGIMTDETLASIADDALLEHLYCFKPRISDAGVRPLASLTRLRSLHLLRVPELTDAALVHISGLTDLEEITLSGTKIDGAGLVHLARMSRLRSLVLADSELNDAGLANLAGLTSLRRLYIGGGKYTDAGIASLSHLTELTELGLGSDRCTDAGLARLAGLTRLETLNLAGPQVTDAAVDHLIPLKSLRQLDLTDTRVSDAAISRLHRALPQVQITVNGTPK